MTAAAATTIAMTETTIYVTNPKITAKITTVGQQHNNKSNINNNRCKNERTALPTKQEQQAYIPKRTTAKGQ